jgi:Tol biopolymer transport system component
MHVATALVAVAATLGVLRMAEPPSRVVRSSLLPPDGANFDATSGAMALSPDGRRIAFVALTEDGKRMLWVRPLDGLSAQPLAGTEEASFPFWSPDSRFIGFFSLGKLRKIDASGRPAQALCDASTARGGSWSADGTILFTPSTTDGIYRVPAAGGTAVQVTTLDAERDESSHGFPAFLPGGVHFLFLVEAGENPEDPQSGFGLWVGSLDSNARSHLLATDASARYASSGHILFLRDRTLVAQRFDAKALALEGEAVPVAENLTRTQRWETTFSVSDSGLLAFQAGAGTQLSQLVLLDRDGRELGAIGKPADYWAPALSQDGRRVAAHVIDPLTQKSDIWVLDLERGTSTRLTFDDNDDITPLWSPDDRFIYFSSRRQGKGDVFRKASSGTGVDEVVLADPEFSLLMSLTADGRLGALMTQSSGGRTGWDIALLDLASGTTRVFLQTPFMELQPALSRDGRWLAYQSNESGRMEVYLQRLDGEGGKWQISTDGGTRPCFSRGEREIVFQASDYKLMLVDVELGPEPAVSVPRMFLEPGVRQIIGMQWDMTADGSRVLVNRALDDPVATPVTLVQNWTEALGQ